MHANERPYGWAVGYKQFPFLGLSDCLVGQTLHNQCQNTHTHTHARVAHTLAQARLDPSTACIPYYTNVPRARKGRRKG